jgi:hypothetical protein
VHVIPAPSGSEEPGIHIRRRWLWIPELPQRGNPE